MVMVVVMMMMMVIAARHHIDPRAVAVTIAIAAPVAMVMVVMMMVVMIPLRQFDLRLGLRRSLRVERLQDLRGIRDRLEKVGVRIDLEDVRRGGRCRRLRRAERADSGDRAQQACDLLIHNHLLMRIARMQKRQPRMFVPRFA